MTKESINEKLKKNERIKTMYQSNCFCATAYLLNNNKNNNNTSNNKNKTINTLKAD